MNRISSAIAATLLLCSATLATAQEYNKVPAGDAQYRQCLSYADKLYEGGKDASPIKGQNKAQAWCTCMWNETPDDFKGNLVTFSETRKGKEINKVCEKYADWG